jgi:hypothetical protein
LSVSTTWPVTGHDPGTSDAQAGPAAGSASGERGARRAAPREHGRQAARSERDRPERASE